MNAKNIFTGFIDSDKDLKLVDKGNFIHALNMRNGKGGVMGSAIPVKGNKIIPNNYLPGPKFSNVCIGTISDYFDQSVIYFNFNEEGNHGIYRYYPFRKHEDFPDGLIEPLIIDSCLNFKRNQLIHGSVIDGFVLWTDAYADNKSITGNPPMKLNQQRASWIGKKICYSFNWTSLTGRWDLRVRYPLSSNLKEQIVFDYFGTGGVEEFADYLQVNPVTSGKLEVKVCGNTLEICYFLPGFTIELVRAGNENKTRWFPVNYLPSVLDCDQIQLIKKTPSLPPFYFYYHTTNSPPLENIIKLEDRYPYQFMYRFVFVDNEKSAFSEPSLIWRGEVRSEHLIIDYTHPFLSDQNWLTFISGVEVAFRESTLSPWRLLDVVPRSEFGILQNRLEFDKEKARTIVQSDGSILNETGQFIKLYDNVPRLVSSIGTISDEDGNATTIVGGLLENYNCPDCIDVEFLESTLFYFSGGDAISNNINGNYGTYYNNKSDLALKENGIYDIGIVYLDDFQRRCTISKVGKLHIGNAYKVSNNVYRTEIKKRIQLQINSTPPEWATHYSIYRTKNLNQEEYSQIHILDVKFIIINSDKAEEEMDEANAEFIKLTIPSQTLKDNTGDSVTKDFSESNILSFGIEKNDFINIIAKTSNTANPNQLENLEQRSYPISICKIDSEGNQCLYIKRNENITYALTENQGLFVEVYRKVDFQNEFYYSTGNSFRIIDGFHQSGRTNNFSINGDQPQTAIQPAIITLLGGDTTIRAADEVISSAVSGTFFYKNSISVKEYSSFKDKSLNKDEDIGNPNIYSPDFGEQFNKNWLRTSDIYIPNSKINGLSSFRELDFKKTNIVFGAIKKLIVTHDILLVVCMFKTQPVYIAKDRLMDLRNNTLVGRSDQLLNLANELKLDLGTFHTESVQEHDGYVYGWDVYRGAIWRYATNGQFPISQYGKDNYFKSLGKNRVCLDPFTDKVVAAVQPEFDAYYTTFRQAALEINAIENDRNIKKHGFTKLPSDPITWCFEELKNGFPTEMSFIPEMYGTMGQVFTGFKNGQLYRFEDIDAPHSNFFGVQYDNTVTFVENDQPTLVKTYDKNIRIQSDKQFEVSCIEIPSNSRYPEGMRSRIKAIKFLNYEGFWHADMLRDMLDPAIEFSDILDPIQRETTALLRGRFLRGEVLIVTLRNSAPGEYFILTGADIEYNFSQKTKA